MPYSFTRHTDGQTLLAAHVNELQVGIEQSGQRPASLLVAASTASTAVKAGADYVCTGTNDNTTIQSAIWAVHGSTEFGVTNNAGCDLFHNRRFQHYANDHGPDAHPAHRPDHRRRRPEHDIQCSQRLQLHRDPHGRRVSRACHARTVGGTPAGLSTLPPLPTRRLLTIPIDGRSVTVAYRPNDITISNLDVVSSAGTFTVTINGSGLGTVS